jgi:hypothetical protein
MPTPIPFADDGGTRAYRANQATWRTPPAAGISIWRFLLAVAAPPPLLAFVAAASWLAWMCFQGVMGTPGAYPRPDRHCGSGSPYTAAHGYGPRSGADTRCARGAGWAGLGCNRAGGVGTGYGRVTQLGLAGDE